MGASPDPTRYAYLAVQSLMREGHEVFPVGLKKGEISGLKIQNGFPGIINVDTVTLYVGPAHQPYWYDYILSLKPKRIIFNPGTENPELENKAAANGIEIEIACTLVMLSVGNY